MTMIYDLLDRAERQASRQTRLVRDLLDVSRVQANRLELRPTRFNLITLVSLRMTVETPAFRPNYSLRGLESLPVAFD